jgi:mRNA deadenylase 3'-5' endonuclease subunit Ccr4
MSKLFKLKFFLFLVHVAIFANDGSFKIMTYNVLNEQFIEPFLYPHLKFPLQSSDQRKNLILQKILNSDPDVICLQEVDSEMFAFLTQELGHLGYFGERSFKPSKFDDGIVTFSRKGFLTLEKNYAVLCEKTSKCLQKAVQPALISFFKTGSNESLVVINTKFKWQDRHERTCQDRSWNQLLYFFREFIDKNQKSFFIIAGDFNLSENEPVYQELIERGFIDVDNQDQRPTFCQQGQWKRIDYVLHRSPFQTRVFSCHSRNFTDLPNDEEPSDHLPVVVEFKEIK